MNWRQSLFSLLVACAICILSLSGNGATLLKAQVFKMPEYVETSAVTTAGHYIIATHLVRSLVKLNKFGQIQSDIATKWHQSANHKIWKITIGDEKYSDGSTITVDDVVASIKRQIRLGGGVHFPFGEIEMVKKIDAKDFEIRLRNPKNDFVYDLAKPEFGVLSVDDQRASAGELAFKVTSGPYSLVSRSGATYHLKRNTFYNVEVGNTCDLIMESSKGDESAVDLIAHKVDFFTTQSNLKNIQHELVLSDKTARGFKPHVAFSYWLSLNPLSSQFREKKLRNQFQQFVSHFSSPVINGVFWERANQLYLPDGDGRPTGAELKIVWDKILKEKGDFSGLRKKLRVVPLKVTNSLVEALLKYLETKYEIEILNYGTENELQQILQSNKFDLKISSNDFSSIDLFENIRTTFNAKRPYIFLPEKNPVMNYIAEAAQATDKQKQSTIFKEIGLYLLDEGFVAPLAYQHVWFYHRANLDLTSWSKLFPEISFWKVRIND